MNAQTPPAINEQTSTVPVEAVVMTPTARQQIVELKRAGYSLGESSGNQCADCDTNCGRGWWMRVSYEYNEWECWCRKCAYDRLHEYDDFDFDEMMRISESS